MDKSQETAHLFAPGHTACAGCGQALGVRLVLRAAGRRVIVTNATGCLEIFSSNYPNSAWEVPWIHSLFENSAAVASGVEAALKATGRIGEIKVISQGGDGSTADIGLGALSGMFERGHDILYVCYDNEAYMNTGVQRSGLTPHGASTATTPAGKQAWGKVQTKKEIPRIAVAHGVPYVATASVAFPHDLDRKVKKALSIRGPKYLQVHVPCPLGWRHDTSLTIEIAKLAADTGLYPLYEIEKGQLTRVRKIARKRPVEEYLKLQGRFRHLFETEQGKREIAEVQRIADSNIEKYGLSEERPSPAEAKREERTGRVFLPIELAAFDGKEGRPAYIAYKGKIYDVSGSSLWERGSHEGQHSAGRDLTSDLAEAPHGEDRLLQFPEVGELRSEGK